MASSALSFTYAAWSYSSGEWQEDNNEVYFGRDASGSLFYSKFSFRTPKIMAKSQKLTLSLTLSQTSNPTPNIAYLSQEDLQPSQLASISSYIVEASASLTGNVNVAAGNTVDFVFETDALMPDTEYHIYIKRKPSSSYNGFTAVYNPLYGSQADKGSVVLDYIQSVIRVGIDGVMHKGIPLVGKDGVWHTAVLLVGDGGVLKISG